MSRPHAVAVRPSVEDYVFFHDRLNAHTAQQREVLRIRIVLLAAQGFTNREIAAALACKPQTVAKWRGRFARHGRAGLLDSPRAGRPPRFSPLQQAQIVALLCQPVQAPPTPAAQPLTPAPETPAGPLPTPAPQPHHPEANTPAAQTGATGAEARPSDDTPSAPDDDTPPAAAAVPDTPPDTVPPRPPSPTPKARPKPQGTPSHAKGQAKQRRAQRKAKRTPAKGQSQQAEAPRQAKRDRAQRKAKPPRPEHKQFARTRPNKDLDGVPAGQPCVGPSGQDAATVPAAQSKRPLGCVLSLEQILDKMEEQLGLRCSRSTLSRLLNGHELKPWRYQYWIFPQAADFVERGGPVLDLYAGYWQGLPLGPGEFVLSFDEKTSIQARWRLYETLVGKPGRVARVEWEYGRGGALQYLACWDVYRGRVFGRCEACNGIVPFDRLVAQVMSQEPYAQAKRVFAIMDNGSAHRGARCVQRLEERYPNLKVVHLPVHASWLNQIEIYFSIIQRALLVPNDFHDLKHLEKSILAFQDAYNLQAIPFAWRFTRAKLTALVKKLEAHKRLAS